jgi:hypothetical protein
MAVNVTINDIPPEMKMKIYQMSGYGYSSQEICKELQYKVNGAYYVKKRIIENILLTPEAHKNVAKFRMEVTKEIRDFPISDKKVRLDELERMRQRLSTLIDNCHFERNKKEIANFLLYSRRMLEILEIARNEMEQHPNVSVGIGIGGGELGGLTDEDLRREREELLRRARIIVKQATSAADEIAEGDEAPDEGEPAQILLASSSGVQRDELQGSTPDVPDVRQQESISDGLPAS